MNNRKQNIFMAILGAASLTMASGALAEPAPPEVQTGKVKVADPTTGTQATGHPTAEQRNSRDVKAETGNLSSAQDDSLLKSQLFFDIHKINQAEIKIGEMASQKGTTQGVKNYGRRLARDHQRADEKIQHMARDRGISLADTRPLNADEKDMIDKNNALIQRLDKADGADFDKEFLSAMKSGHKEAIDKVSSGIKKVTDGDAKTLLSDILDDLKQHEQIAQRLDASFNKTSVAKRSKHKR